MEFDDQEKERLYEEFIDNKTVAICKHPDRALTNAVIQENDVSQVLFFKTWQPCDIEKSQRKSLYL